MSEKLITARKLMQNKDERFANALTPEIIDRLNKIIKHEYLTMEHHGQFRVSFHANGGFPHELVSAIKNQLCCAGYDCCGITYFYVNGHSRIAELIFNFPDELRE